MGRIIAIDYGRKRTGIAATDILQMIANGVATVPSGEVVKYLSDYISREPVDYHDVGSRIGKGRYDSGVGVVAAVTQQRAATV